MGKCIHLTSSADDVSGIWTIVGSIPLGSILCQTFGSCMVLLWFSTRNAWEVGLIDRLPLCPMMLAIGHNIPTSALPSTFGIIMSLSVSYGIHDLVWLAFPLPVFGSYILVSFIHPNCKCLMSGRYHSHRHAMQVPVIVLAREHESCTWYAPPTLTSRVTQYGLTLWRFTLRMLHTSCIKQCLIV
jgi:hypothetical protein